MSTVPQKVFSPSSWIEGVPAQETVKEAQGKSKGIPEGQSLKPSSSYGFPWVQGRHDAYFKRS